MKVEFDFDPRNASSSRKPQARDQNDQKVVDQKARQLALAYYINTMIETGQAADIASIAKAAGISRARISQVLDMALLAPGIQEGILSGSVTLGSHTLRRLSGMPSWEQQRRWLESSL